MTRLKLILLLAAFTGILGTCQAQHHSPVSEPKNEVLMAGKKYTNGIYITWWHSVHTVYGLHKAPAAKRITTTLSTHQVKLFNRDSASVQYLDTTASRYFQKYQSAELKLYPAKGEPATYKSSNGVYPEIIEAIRRNRKVPFILVLHRNASGTNTGLPGTGDTLRYRMKHKL